MKRLVIYFSRKGNNFVSGSITNLKEGNVEKIVQMIQACTDTDVFEVVRKEPYPIDYRECVNESGKELKEDARPELVNYLDDISEYDMIYVVGPCWCGNYPMPLASQLEKLDFNGKKVRYIISHEGSGLARSKENITSWCKNAIVLDGLGVKGCDITEEELTGWIDKEEM